MSTDTPEQEQPLRTVSGIGTNHAEEMNELLAQRLTSVIDMELTLKHVHWNVVGPNFIAVHEMLDTFVAEVRDIVDQIAERIRTLGGVPTGLPGALVKNRTWDDYSLGQASTQEHLRALDVVYDGIILDHRRAIAHGANLDPVSEGMLVDQTATLEMQQWFVRSFLKGTQPDEDAHRFGSADRAPTDQEAAAAPASVSEETGDHYREMAVTGANAKGEGSI
ncbi:MAG: DNA starvation/stationary phase protection protein [Acidimicrobiales bacterium]|nr:DNA starvation/stationary phase protection protein [Acidimicrobiales bacterium]